MSKRAGIKTELSYSYWNFDIPIPQILKKYNFATELKKNIKNTILNGSFDNYGRILPLIVQAPFMGIDVMKQKPSIEIKIDENKIKHTYLDNTIHISYNAKFDVIVTWRVK